MAELELPYVPVDPGIGESEKMDHFLDIADMHDDPFGALRVVGFLLWVGRNHPTGKIGRLSDRKMAKEMLWPADRDPTECRRFMLEARWLTEDEDGCLSWVNWHKYGGRVLEAREAYRDRDRTKKRRRRCREAGHPPESCQCPDVSPGDVSGTEGDVPVDPPFVPLASPDGPAASPPMKVKGEGEGGSSSSALSTERTLTVSDVNGMLHDWARDRGWDASQGIPPKHVPKFTDAALFSEQEVIFARGKAEEKPGTPNPGLFLSIVLSERGRPEVRTRGSPTNGHRGHHPGSEDFADGDVRL